MVRQNSKCASLQQVSKLWRWEQLTEIRVLAPFLPSLPLEKASTEGEKTGCGNKDGRRWLRIAKATKEARFRALRKSEPRHCNRRRDGRLGGSPRAHPIGVRGRRPGSERPHWRADENGDDWRRTSRSWSVLHPRRRCQPCRRRRPEPGTDYHQVLRLHAIRRQRVASRRVPRQTHAAALQCRSRRM
ncbi:unnamed protein product, partial [Phaeothamnion confervicola]